MIQHFFPIFVIVTSNIVYNICAKSTPEAINPLASLSVTYFVATIFSIVLYYLTSTTKSLHDEYMHLNWTSFIFGLSLVTLEFGYLIMYRAGWTISTGSLVANISLAVILIFVGILIYHEQITLKQIFGMIFCAFGLIFINT